MDDKFVDRIKQTLTKTTFVQTRDDAAIKSTIEILLSNNSVSQKQKDLENLGFSYSIDRIYHLSRRMQTEYITFKRSNDNYYDLELDVEQKFDRLQHLMDQQYERLCMALEEDNKNTDVLTLDDRADVLTDEEKARLSLYLREYYTGTISEANKKYLLAFTTRKASSNKIEEKLEKYFRMVQKFYELKKQILGLKNLNDKDRFDKATPVNDNKDNVRKFTKVSFKKVNAEDEDME